MFAKKSENKIGRKLVSNKIRTNLSTKVGRDQVSIGEAPPVGMPHPL